MGHELKINDTVTIYFGDSIRELLKKSLRKKNTYFVNYVVNSIDDDVLTVFPNTLQNSDELPYEISVIRIGKTDRHIISEKDFSFLRDCSKDELLEYADRRGYNHKEFKEALKPFRKGTK